MRNDVEAAIEMIRHNLLATGSDVELVSTTDLGIVCVNLSGECCSGRLRRLMTILHIEDTIKKQVPGIKVVMENS